MKYKTEIKWGIILGVASILYEIILYLFGFYDDRIEERMLWSTLGLLLFPVFIGLSMAEKRRTFYDGQMTYMQAVFTGVVTGVMAIPVLVIGTYILITYISPEFFTTAIAHAEQSGANATAAREYFNTKAYLAQVVLGGMGFPVFASLILGLFFKRKSK